MCVCVCRGLMNQLTIVEFDPHWVLCIAALYQSTSLQEAMISDLIKQTISIVISLILMFSKFVALCQTKLIFVNIYTCIGVILCTYISAHIHAHICKLSVTMRTTFVCVPGFYVMTHNNKFCLPTLFSTSFYQNLSFFSSLPFPFSSVRQGW